MIKYLVVCLIVCFTTVSVSFTQSTKKNDTADEIALPDVTTVVPGNTLQTGKDAVPDFSGVLPGKDTAAPVLPRLPDTKIDTSGTVTEDRTSGGGKKDIYAEGLIGGGYPGFFTGDFSLYRSQGNNPFLLKFGHESASGYSRESLSDGFFDTSTDISGEKTFTGDKTVLNLKAAYKRSEDGLQDNSPVFYDMTKQLLSGSGSADIKCTDNFNLSLTADSDFYNRYAGENGSDTVPEAEKGISVFYLNPSASGIWTKDGVTVILSGVYNLECNAGDDSAFTGYDGDLTELSLHRGQFGQKISWSNDVFSFYEAASAVVGTAIGSGSVIVPFTAGATAKVGNPGAVIVLSAEGGLSSGLESCRELEEKYKFTYLSFIPGETTDWYGIFSASVPVYGRFSAVSSVEYRKTAFSNGTWEPVYSGTSASGLYGFVQRDRTLLKTVESLSTTVKNISLTADWTAYWKDVPVLENEQTLGLSAGIQDAKADKGADTSVRFELGDDADNVPEIAVSGFCRLSPGLRLDLKAEDIIKLLSGESRTYAGKYITRSGSASVFLKFFF